MLNRERLIRFIPKPKNEEVIIYDIELKDLIDVNVIEEYEKDLYVFLEKKETYNLIKNKIKEMEKSIDNIYLFNTSWTREDYLVRLKNDTKTYSIMYKDINKIENNISILQKKLNAMNEKIKMQEEKENLNIKKKKENIDIEIEKDKDILIDLNEKVSFLKMQLNFIEENISENEEELNYLLDAEANLGEGKNKCIICGSYIDNYAEIISRLKNKILKKTQKSQRLIGKKENIEREIAYYEDKVSKTKTRLNNNIYIKKEDKNIYIKKSIDILRLEGLRDEIINDISKQEKQLKNNSDLKSEKYISLKNNIEKYKLSLQNLNKIKKIQEDLKEDINNYNSLKNELMELYKRLSKYKQFITLYYKIYEKKANEYFGPNFKFKFFEFEDIKFKPILEVKYNDIEYSELDEKTKKEVDSIFTEKISIFY